MPFDEFVNDERPGARRFRDILERERRDMAWLVHAVACLYDEISGGLISKPMTYPDEVIGAFNDRIEREADEAVAAERARIKRGVARLRVDEIVGASLDYEHGWNAATARVLRIVEGET